MRDLVHSSMPRVEERRDGHQVVGRLQSQALDLALNLEQAHIGCSLVRRLKVVDCMEMHHVVSRAWLDLAGKQSSVLVQTVLMVRMRLLPTKMVGCFPAAVDLLAEVTSREAHQP